MDELKLSRIFPFKQFILLIALWQLIHCFYEVCRVSLVFFNFFPLEFPLADRFSMGPSTCLTLLYKFHDHHMVHIERLV